MDRSQSNLLARLRADLAAIEARAGASQVLPFGIEILDNRLADRGLNAAALHEITPTAPRLAENAAATLFTAGIAARFAAQGRPALWVASRFDLYAPGLEQAGLGPNQVMFVEARSDEDVLAVMEDGLRDGALGVVIAEVRRASLTATRRLQLAAADGQTPALLFRHWRKRDLCPLTEPSAAATRWRIGCAPSRPLGIPGVGRARWTVELARQRGGNPFSFVLEACDGEGRLALSPATRDRAVAETGADALAA